MTPQAMREKLERYETALAGCGKSAKFGKEKLAA
jgi:hypothetical protein